MLGHSSSWPYPLAHPTQKLAPAHHGNPPRRAEGSRREVQGTEGDTTKGLGEE
jgi:hypothetical protein